jgi:hypothetical protein
MTEAQRKRSVPKALTLVGGLVVVVALGVVKYYWTIADVDCKISGTDVQCRATASGSDPTSICWTARITCKDGSQASINACGVGGGGREVDRLIPLIDIQKAARCDAPSSVTVENVKSKRIVL